jgi:hypothetical protein
MPKIYIDYSDGRYYYCGTEKDAIADPARFLYKAPVDLTEEEMAEFEKHLYNDAKWQNKFQVADNADYDRRMAEAQKRLDETGEL